MGDCESVFFFGFGAYSLLGEGDEGAAHCHMPLIGYTPYLSRQAGREGNAVPCRPDGKGPAWRLCCNAHVCILADYGF